MDGVSRAVRQGLVFLILWFFSDLEGMRIIFFFVVEGGFAF